MRNFAKNDRVGPAGDIKNDRMVTVVNKTKREAFTFTTQAMAARYVKVSTQTITRRMPWYEDADLIICKGVLLKNDMKAREGSFGDFYKKT